MGNCLLPCRLLWVSTLNQVCGSLPAKLAWDTSVSPHDIAPFLEYADWKQLILMLMKAQTCHSALPRDGAALRCSTPAPRAFLHPSGFLACIFRLPISSLSFFFKIFFFWSLYWICYNIAPVSYFGFLVMRHVDLSSLTKDWTLIPALGDEVFTLGHQKSPLWALSTLSIIPFCSAYPELV